MSVEQEGTIGRWPPVVTVGAWAPGCTAARHGAETGSNSEEAHVNTKYHRPRTLDEALALAAGADAVILGGGTTVNARPGRPPSVVVDLQALDLGGIETDGGSVRLGATTRLQEVVDSKLVPEVLGITLEKALLQEPKLNELAAADARWLIVTAYGVRFGNIQVNADLKHKIALALKHVKAVLRAKP